MKAKLGMISLAVMVSALVAVSAHGAEKKAPTVNDHLKAAVNAYIAIQDSLAKDSVEGVSASAAKISKAADDAIAIEKKEKKKNAELINCLEHLSKAAKKLTGDKLALKGARNDFKELSETVACLVEDHVPADAAEGIQQFECSMAKATWLQKGKSPRNPYYGKSMLECGEAKALKHGGCKNCKKHKKDGKGMMGHEGHEGHEGHKLEGVSMPEKHEGCEHKD